MPYTPTDYPQRIAKLPAHARDIWISTFNSALAQYKDEKLANQTAWASVKRLYKKVGDKWVKKAAEMFNCECLKCSFVLKSIKHCVDITCPKCGGQMRRVERPGAGRATNEPMNQLQKLIKAAVWTTKYVNDLPDSAFAIILPGGEKDDTGRTKPRSLRRLPYKDTDGKVDLPHIRNALARAPQIKGAPAGVVDAAISKLRKILEDMRKKASISYPVSLSEMKFDDGKMTTEIQVLSVGTWKHPVYGKIKIDDKAIGDFISNFKTSVRKDIAITEGHPVGDEEKPAVGWFRQLINKGVDGLWATIEWTKDGFDMIKKKAYKYFSPEFYDNYEDPETHETYNNVLVGGALTNRPYFKGLQAIVLSEMTLDDKMSDLNLEEILKKEIGDLTDEEKKFIKENEDKLDDDAKTKYADVLKEEKKDNDDNKDDDNKDDDDKKTDLEKVLEKDADDFTDEDKQTIKDNEDELTDEQKETHKDILEGEGSGAAEGSEKSVTLSESAVKMMTERAKAGVKALAILRGKEAEETVEKFTFSETNQDGIILPKSKDKVVAFLLSLTAEQQNKFKEILAELPKAHLFKELGKDVVIKGDANDQVQTLVEAKMKADPKLEYRPALELVLSENPELQKQVAA